MICHDNTRRAWVRAHRDKHGQRDLNGLDYVEVADDKSQTILTAYFIGKLPKQLRVDKPALVKYLRIEGGRRVRDIRIVDVDPHLEDREDLDDYLVIEVDKPGDFSTYTLRLIDLPGIDPHYDRAEFNFKVDCPSDLDCATPANCPPPKLDEPDINYLAKDYASFRQLILDRLALIMPQWQERHVPDLGIALVEVLAYAGDHLSYYQDAVATEAYLDTSRQRISVRRHTRLVDYRLHEGCNARAWVCLATDQDFEIKLDEVYFITGLPQMANIAERAITVEDLRNIPSAAYDVFEPLVADRKQSLPLRAAHGEIHFYTWGDRECCLPRGATSASLRDRWIYPEDTSHDNDVAYAVKQQPIEPKPIEPSIDPSKLKRTLDLHVGDVLIFEEVIGPKTGSPADADPKRRCVVRLTKVTLNEDPVIPTPIAAGNHQVPWATPVVDIEWAAADALPFALCLSALGPAPDCAYLDNITVARGNVLLVDHGRTLQPPEPIGRVPLKTTHAICECEGEPGDITLSAGRFEPRLSRVPLTFSQTVAFESISAKKLLEQDARAAVPAVYLISIPGAPDGTRSLFEWSDLNDATSLAKSILRAGWTPATSTRGIRLSRRTQQLLREAQTPDGVTAELRQSLQADLQAMLVCWIPYPDLLGSGPDDCHFIVEIDNDSVAHLRFGDDEFGQRPTPGTVFFAIYRIGNGAVGNVGADAIAQLVSRSTLSGPTILVRNPLPASGGVDPEPIAEAKLYAPSLFRKRLERAIIAADYATIAQREFDLDLQRATAQLAWTGSWYEAEVAIDPRGAAIDNDPLEQAVAARLDRYRRMGHDLQVAAAHYVPLDVEVTVCVKPAYLRGHVKAALLEVFSNRTLPNGVLGFFHPDRLTFGDGIYLSQIVATAQAIEGVDSVTVTKLQRLFEAKNDEIKNGVLPLGPFEIAQVDNDPNYPEHGRFTLVMQGGR
jgi:hypothetical protein